MRMLKAKNRSLWLILTLLMFIHCNIATGDHELNKQHFDITISNRSVQLEPNVIRVTQDTQVTLSWSSDETGSLHLHGYDIEFDVDPTQVETVTFLANATGRFPITSHGFGDEGGHGHKALLYIEIYPD